MRESGRLSELCRFVSGLTTDSLPSGVLEQAKRVLMDTAGVMAAGAGSPEVGALAGMLGGGRDRPVACPGRPEWFSPLEAALVGGAAGSGLEYEEGNSAAMGHPAVQLVPALLVESQTAHASGADLVRALVGGYEVASRVSRASAMRRGLHPTGTWGVVGSAAAVGLLRGRSSREIEELANLSASYAFSPYVRNSFAGWSAAATFAGAVNHAGVLSNLFYDAGFRADPASFDMTFSRFLAEDHDPEILVRGLGREPFAIELNYFKPYPTCRFTHPAMEALRKALGEGGVGPEDVERITVHSFGAAVHGGSVVPRNAEAFRFSVPYILGAVIAHGRVDPDLFDEASVGDRSVQDLAQRVELVHSPDYEAMRPERSPARVIVRLRDGRELAGEVLDCLGDPSNPIDGEALQGKFLSLTEKVIGKDRARAFLEGLSDLEGAADAGRWIRLLRPEEGEGL